MYKDIVDFAELSKFMDQKLKNYSSGMQVRLAFSIAIRAESDILLLDEVLAVGDAAFQQKCFNYFEELKEQKKTVVFVSHDMDNIRRFCNRAIYIKDGDLVHNGSPSEIADIYIEENLDNSQTNTENEGKYPSKKHSLSAKITSQTEDSVTIKLSYKSLEKDEMYVGISVIKDGISIAEINTSNAKPLKGSGAISYTLDAKLLNGGMYHIGAGLFRSRNAELLAFIKKKAEFIVKGEDPTKGAALRLTDAWESK
jgi:ABC-2 type transport system ATP-binding protein